MAELGFRTVDEMVGRVDKLKVRDNLSHWKQKNLDLSLILAQPEVQEGQDVIKLKSKITLLINKLTEILRVS